MTLCRCEPEADRPQSPRTPLWRASALTLSIVNAVMMAGTAHPQNAADSQSSTNAPAKAGATNAPAKLPDVVVQGQRTSDYKPEALSSPKYTQPLRDVPQTVTVVPQAVIEQQGATTLRDVLRNVPGISFQAGEGGVPAGDNMSIRGFSARTDTFVDGVRDFGGYSRDPFNSEQIEVAKGPASAYAGRGSTGGSVNLVTKAPGLAPSYGGTLGLGTDEYKRATLDLNTPLNGIGIKGSALRLNGMWTEAETAGRDAVENKRWGIAPSLVFGLGTPTRVTVNYLHLDQDNIPDYGIPWVPAGSSNGVPVPNTNPVLARHSNQAPPVDFENFYGLKARDFEKTRTDLPTVRLEHDFNDSFRLQNLTRYGQTSRDSVITAPRFVDLDTSTNTLYGTRVNRQIQSRDQVDRIVANQTALTSSFETWKLGHTVVASVDYAHEAEENFARAGTTSQTDIFDPNPYDPNPGPVRRTGARVEAEADSVGLALFDTIEFTEQWQLTGGLRWEYFDLGFKSYAPNGDLTAGTPVSRVDRLLDWRTGLVYKPKPIGNIYAAYGTSSNPSAEGLSLSTNATAASNVRLDPEESRTYEVGTKWDLFQNRLNLSLALFRTEKINARTEDPVDSSDLVVLQGKQRVDGVEVGAAGSITEKWKIFAGYAFMHSEVVSSKNRSEVGRRVNNTPEHTFSLWTTYSLPWNFEVGGGAYYTGSRLNTTAPPNTREAEGYWLGDAMLGYNLSRNFSLRLNVYNLTDEKYIDRVGGGHFVPGAARSAVLTASVKF